MPYVTRNGEGRIVGVSAAAQDGAEAIAADAVELREFLAGLGSDPGALPQSDLKLIRAIEDVIDLLISKNVICITDLPAAVQNKLIERRSLRHSLNALKLIGDEDQGII